MLDFATRSPYTGPAFGRPAPDCQPIHGFIRPLRRAVRSAWDGPGLTRIGGTAMPTGTIARLIIDKGFGFIRDEGGIEHFFHRSSVRQAVFELLREGQRVEFQAEESAKGPRAGDVRLIEG